MSWTVHVIENTITVDDSARSALEELPDEGYVFEEGCGGVRNGKLCFDEDAMEHIDYLWSESVREILVTHNAVGRVTFGSLEGDNKETFWGYEFGPHIGPYGYRRLKGTLTWEAE